MQEIIIPKPGGNWKRQKKKCKDKLGKIALREPRSAEQWRIRLLYERLFQIMMRRYNDYGQD